MLMLSLDRDLLIPGRSDTERRFADYAPFLESLDVLIPADVESQRQITAIISVRSVPGNLFFKSIRLILTGISLCRMKNINLITANDPIIGLPGYLIRIFSPQTKLLVNVLGLEITDSYWLSEKPLFHQAIRTIQIFVLNKADIIRSDSRRAVEQLVSLGIPRQKIKFVPLIPSVPVIQRLKKIGENKLNRPSQFDILTVGSLNWQKGQDVLLKALGQVKLSFPDIKLGLIGEGTDKKKLRELVNKLHLEKNVEFIGAVPYDSLPNYYLSSKLLAVPSRFEGGPRVVMEAAFCRTPVVSTDVGSVPDMLINGKSGYIVPINNSAKLAEKIIDLLKHQSRRVSFAYQACKQIGKYCDPETNRKATINFWQGSVSQ